MDLDKESVIQVSHVYKDFVLPTSKNKTIKGLFTTFYKNKKGSYEIQHALKDISLQINKGEFFGILGRNGSGKSTLLKMLAGIYHPTKGSIKTKGKLVPFIELGVGFNPELTGKENVYLNAAMMGFTQVDTDSMYEEIVRFAELEEFMGQKLKNYSSGMQVRLAFSVAVKAKADILLVDEVLAVGDADFQRKCFDYFKYLKKQKTTVVFVSHDMGAVREFCDRAVLIEKNRIVAEGKASIIANKYAQLFLDKNTEKINTNDDKRWGDFSAKITNVEKITIKDDYINIEASAIVNKDIDDLIYGIHVSDQSGNEITAMNNRMIKQPDLKDLKKNSLLFFKWSMLNVFNDGQYYITLTLVGSSGVVFDWYSDATSFKVNRIERSTTAVLPPVKVTHKIKA